MLKKIIILIVVGTAILSPLIAHAQSGFHFVPCGRSDQVGTDDENCKLEHLIILMVRITNYLISVAAIVAMYQILLSGWNLVSSVGNAEKIQKAKAAISNAVVGFGIVVLAFVFVNLLINGIFGKPGQTRNWWEVQCVYNPSEPGCPFSTAPGPLPPPPGS